MPFFRALTLFLALLACSATQAQVVATIAAPAGRGADVAINPSTQRVYVAGDSANAVAVIDGATNTVLQQVAVGRRPQFVAVNATTNRIYASNTGDGTLSVIDGTTLAVASLPIGGAGPIVIDERTNRTYVMRQGNNGEVTVVDANNNWYTINTGSHTPFGLVVNPDTNRLYVSHLNSGDVRAIDMSSTSDHPPTVSILVAGNPSAIALNRATNKVYVTSDDSRGPVVEIDGATNVATRIVTPGHANPPRDIVVNPVTNRIYVSFSFEVVVIDGATRAVSYIPTGFVGKLAVDTAHDRVYGIGDNNTVIVIDGATQSFSHVPVPNNASGLAVNAATNRIYAIGLGTAVLDGAAIGTPPPNFGTNLQGMWWNWPAGSESGWGFNIAHQGNTIFATWFTYDTDGSALWLVMPNAARVSDKLYEGDVFRTTGPAYNAATFDPATVHTTAVGRLSISLTENAPDRAVLSGTINGNPIFKVITREVFAAPVPTCTAGGTPGAQPNYQDMWWAAPAGSESGWGLNIAHQGDIVFAVLFEYDEAGKALWLVAPNVARTGNANYSGTLYRTGGPPYTTQFWNSSQVSVMPVGTLSLAFSDAGNGVLTYSYAGVTRTKTITREAFGTPATVCR